MTNQKETMIFKIPKSSINAEFSKYKNGNWNMQIINMRTREKKTIERSMNQAMMIKIMKELVKNPTESNAKNSFEINYVILKLKVEGYKLKTKTKNKCLHSKSD